MKKITRKISFPTYQMRFFFPFLKPFWTPLIFKLHNLFIFIHFLKNEIVIEAAPEVLQIIFEF
jgi:hypothetical protein